MSKAPSPLLATTTTFDTKVGVFHIQTEDLGRQASAHHHPTCSWMVGRILKSTKKSYAEHLGTEGLSDVVPR